MRHRKKGNHLSRTASHKKALMRNLAVQVFEHKEIRTTLAKAKELRGYVERLITYGKKGTLHHRRLAFRFLQNKQAVKTLFDEIAPVYEDRPGGYTRIIKLGNRKGDNAAISIFQLVGFEKIKPKSEKKKKAEVKKPKPVEETPKVEEKEAVTQQETPAQSEEPKAQPEEQVAEEKQEITDKEEAPKEAQEKSEKGEQDKKEDSEESKKE